MSETNVGLSIALSQMDLPVLTATVVKADESVNVGKLVDESDSESDDESLDKWFFDCAFSAGPKQLKTTGR